MRILITGGAGFIGSHLADDLIGSIVVANDKPLQMNIEGALPVSFPRRLHDLGVAALVLAVPIFKSGTCVAILEVLDPDPRFHRRSLRACSFTSDRLAHHLPSPSSAGSSTVSP